jgi:hypothetical protein
MQSIRSTLYSQQGDIKIAAGTNNEWAEDHVYEKSTHFPRVISKNLLIANTDL